MAEHEDESAEKLLREVLGWQQGDVFDLSGHIELVSPPSGLVPVTDIGICALVSQTCDVVGDPQFKPFVKVAGVSIDKGRAGQARTDRTPQLAWLPGFDVNAVAELDRIATVRKIDLEGKRKARGCRTDAELRKFQRSLGRHFRRFAFPDELNPALAPMVEHLDAGRKGGKPEALPLSDLLQIRAFVEGEWTDEELNVELTFLVRNPLPITDLNLAEPAQVTDARSWAEGRTCCEIAERLSQEPELLAHLPLWEALVKEWVKRAVPQGRIVSFTPMVTDVYTYTAAEMLESDQVELDSLTRGEKAS